MSKHHTSHTKPAAHGAAPEAASAGNDGQDLETARLAYSYWEAGGRTEGLAEDDWARAEQEVTALRLR